AGEVMKAKKVKFNYMVGTMIEVPRAAITADKIAEHAEFFSFGTNDLTQMTLGFSRDDAGKFIAEYMDDSNGTRERVLVADPFNTLDIDGVGELVKLGAEKGRTMNPRLKLGVCGERGGDPDSIRFCHSIGLDYVSCSPYRVPVARLTAA